jgi:hypothetical protein
MTDKNFHQYETYHPHSLGSTTTAISTLGRYEPECEEVDHVGQLQEDGKLDSQGSEEG